MNYFFFVYFADLFVRLRILAPHNPKVAASLVACLSRDQQNISKNGACGAPAVYVKKTPLLYKARALQSTAKLVSITNSKKEVFQPHLPVRLPCYDLAPVTSFALGRSLRSRTSGAPSFHGLTGGVYKARERIHRAMADARLLANPTSWSRVADSNPNWDGFSRSASCRQVASLCTHHCNTCVAPDVRAVLI